MHWLHLTRIAVLGFLILCAIIVLGVSARVINITETYGSEYFDYSALGVATAVLTIVTIPVMLVLDFFYTGFFTSMILVELVWLTILWILFLATGADSANDLTEIDNNCDFIYDVENEACRETQALAAFSFLAWIALMGYTIALLVMTILGARNGSGIWFSTVKQSFVPGAIISQPATTETSGGAIPMRTAPAAAPAAADASQAA